MLEDKAGNQRTETSLTMFQRVLIWWQLRFEGDDDPDDRKWADRI